MANPALHRVFTASGGDQAADRVRTGDQLNHNDVEAIPQPVLHCEGCALQERCMGARLAALDSEQTLTTHRHSSTFNRRQHLFHQGERPDALYIIKSGSAKLTMISALGKEQVLGFYMPGEVLGLDALGAESHRSSAVALERTLVCMIPLAGLEKLAGGYYCLYRLLSAELIRDQRAIELIRKKDAMSKIASFLLCQSERYTARGYSGRCFNLSMKREEIANHLGLAIETVSRVFSRLQEAGLLRLHRRQVNILDFPALKAIACEGSHAVLDAG